MRTIRPNRFFSYKEYFHMPQVIEGIISLIHFATLPEIRASFNDIKTVFVPEGQSCQFSTRKMTNRGEIGTINAAVGAVGGIFYCRY